MTDARRALVEWCRAQQISALEAIKQGCKYPEGARLCVRDCFREELLIEGEQGEHTDDWES